MSLDENLNEDELPEQFSDDPEEQLRIENELLRIKLQAEHGAEFGGALEDIPAEIEHFFLNNILSMQKEMDSDEKITVLELLGFPKNFQHESQHSDEEIEFELTLLQDFLVERSIYLTFEYSYPARVKYKFIMEEFFFHEVRKFKIPDLTYHFTYEVFHPNRKGSLNAAATNFLNSWLDQDLEFLEEMTEDLIISGKQAKALKKQEVMKSIRHLFEAYTEFKNGSFTIQHVDLEEKPGNHELKASGSVEGRISYEARLESGEQVKIDEPFRLSMELHYTAWLLVSINMPGLLL